MDSCAADGTFALILTQHSKIVLVFLTRISPVSHHPLILNPQYKFVLDVLVNVEKLVESRYLYAFKTSI
jgi:hypothetical protein